MTNRDPIDSFAEEIARLRKWQQEALPYLNGSAAIMKLVGASGEQITTLDRLIAEAQED